MVSSSNLYEMLKEVWEREVSSPGLQRLPENFYEQLARHLLTLEHEARREREALLGDAEEEPSGEPQVPPNPVRTFVVGLFAVAAVLVAVFVVYRYVVAPEEEGGTTTQPTTQPRRPEPPRQIGPQFVDVTKDAGLMVATRQGDSAVVKRFISEAKGGGIAFIDYDNDGWLDVYIVNAGPLSRPATRTAASAPARRSPSADYLMHNRGDGTFEDVTDTAGVGDTGYGIGVCAGDFDNDGFVDIYVTNLGPNVLYRNRGDGTFEDVTDTAGVGGGNTYSVGAAFLDYDLDGDLDLYVADYVKDPSRPAPLSGRWKGGRVFFGPRGLSGLPDHLYRNNGDGTFTDVSQAAGIAAFPRRSLGVVAGDADGDGRPDILVACDRQPNLYFRNLGDGRFEERGLVSGLAYAAEGLAFGSQGIDMGDLDGDLRPEVVVGNFSGQPLQVYRSFSRNLWLPADHAPGLRGALVAFTTFGVCLADYDNDGDLDILTANGHVYPDVVQFDQMTRYGLPSAILVNAGRWRWLRLVSQAGSGVALPLPSRGLAVGDYDNDGDLDMLMANIDRAPTLLANQGPVAGRFLEIRLQWRRSNRSAVGAKITVRVGAARRVFEVKSGSGFASQSDLRCHVGLGAASTADQVTIHWPSGQTDEALNVPAGSLVTAVEGKGLTWEPFVKSAEPGTSGEVRTRPAGSPF